MKEIAVIGPVEFTLGFRLAGIKHVVDTGSLSEGMVKLLDNSEVGIVITDEETMSSLDEYIKEKVIGSINPVVVVVSDKVQQDELRKMIIQSIGVDLMKEE
ncbi:V-type ATP synthase subunit F [Candidatus Woesearchaeota archaeon]|nr:V-type ATP synthase subunit F [Candidatus Woesearchaeota archaeon]